MIIYLLYIGLVLGHAMDKSSGLGSAIVAMGAVLAVWTSAITFVVSKMLGSTATLGESIKASIAALLAVWLSVHFSLQPVQKVPFVVYLAPILAVGVATLVLEHMLSLAWPRSLAVVLANGALAWVVAKVLLPMGVFLIKGI